MKRTLENPLGQRDRIDRVARYRSLGCRGGTVWFTGRSRSNKRAIAAAIERKLVRHGVHAYLLDGEVLQQQPRGDLGITHGICAENTRCLGELSRILADSGCVVLTVCVSPYRIDRDSERRRHAESNLLFLEIVVDTPRKAGRQRDHDGGCDGMRRGEPVESATVDRLYEASQDPELTLEPAEQSLDACVRAAVAVMQRVGMVRFELKQQAPLETPGAGSGPGRIRSGRPGS